MSEEDRENVVSGCNVLGNALLGVCRSCGPCQHPEDDEDRSFDTLVGAVCDAIDLDAFFMKEACCSLCMQTFSRRKRDIFCKHLHTHVRDSIMVTGLSSLDPVTVLTPCHCKDTAPPSWNRKSPVHFHIPGELLFDGQPRVLWRPKRRHTLCGINTCKNAGLWCSPAGGRKRMPKSMDAHEACQGRADLLFGWLMDWLEAKRSCIWVSETQDMEVDEKPCHQEESCAPSLSSPPPRKRLKRKSGAKGHGPRRARACNSEELDSLARVLYKWQLPGVEQRDQDTFIVQRAVPSNDRPVVRHGDTKSCGCSSLVCPHNDPACTVELQILVECCEEKLFTVLRQAGHEKWLEDETLKVFTLGYHDHHTQRGSASRGRSGRTLHFALFSEQNCSPSQWVVMSVTETIHRKEDGHQSVRTVLCSCSPYHCPHELLASSMYTEFSPSCLGDAVHESPGAARKEMDGYNQYRSTNPWRLSDGDVVRMTTPKMLSQLKSWVTSGGKTAPSPVCPSCGRQGVPSRDNPDVTIIGTEFVYPDVPGAWGFCRNRACTIGRFPSFLVQHGIFLGSKKFGYTTDFLLSFMDLMIIGATPFDAILETHKSRLEMVDKLVPLPAGVSTPVSLLPGKDIIQAACYGFMAALQPEWSCCPHCGVYPTVLCADCNHKGCRTKGKHTMDSDSEYASAVADHRERMRQHAEACGMSESDVEVSQTSICSTRLLNILAKRTLNRASNPSVAQPQEEPRLGQAPVLVNPLSAKRVQIGEDTVEISFQSEHLKKSTAERFLRGQRRNLMLDKYKLDVLRVQTAGIVKQIKGILAWHDHRDRCQGSNRQKSRHMKQLEAEGVVPEVLEEELSLTRRDHLRASLSALEFAMQSPQEHGRGQGPSSRESTKEVKSLLVQALNSAGVCWLSGVKKPRVLSTREARIAELLCMDMHGLRETMRMVCQIDKAPDKGMPTTLKQKWYMYHVLFPEGHVSKQVSSKGGSSNACNSGTLSQQNKAAAEPLDDLSVGWEKVVDRCLEQVSGCLLGVIPEGMAQSVFLEEDDLSSEAAADLQHQGFLLAAERVNCMTLEELRKLAGSLNISTTNVGKRQLARNITMFLRSRTSPLSAVEEDHFKFFSAKAHKTGGWGGLCCPHGVLYAVKLLSRAESQYDILDLLLSLGPTTPNVVLYDYAAGLAASIQKRCPWMFPHEQHPRGSLYQPDHTLEDGQLLVDALREKPKETVQAFQVQIPAIRPEYLRGTMGMNVDPQRVQYAHLLGPAVPHPVTGETGLLVLVDKFHQNNSTSPLTELRKVSLVKDFAENTQAMEQRNRILNRYNRFMNSLGPETAPLVLTHVICHVNKVLVNDLVRRNRGKPDQIPPHLVDLLAAAEEEEEMAEEE